VITNNWGNGFTGAIRITNNGSRAINGWNVGWSYTGNTRVSSTWNATVSGSNPYTATNLSWNGTIQPGQSVEFGLQGTYSGSIETPRLTGSVCN
jgi:rhamnogalacturonan endolyase